MIKKMILMLIIPLLFMGSVEAMDMRVKIGADLAKVIMTHAIVAPDTPGIYDPHKDVDKCPCKGTGMIAQKDGNVTECPYHGKGEIGDTPAPKVQYKESVFFEKEYCNCDDCDCSDCGCLTGDCPCKDGAAKEAVQMVTKATTVKKKYDYILYHMGADWCAPCRKMLREVWPRESDGKTYNNDMRDLLSEHKIRFIPLDATNDEHTKYFKAYKKTMNGYPTIIMISSSNYNQPLFWRHGAWSKDKMMKDIKKFAENRNEKSN